MFQGLSLTQRASLIKNKITDTDSLIDTVEKEFKKWGVLKYTWWVIDILAFQNPVNPSFREIFYLPRYGKALKRFDSLKKRKLLTDRELDLKEYRNVEHLENMLEDVIDPRDETRLLKSKQAEVIYNKGKLRVIAVYTPEAVKLFGSGVRNRSNPWCIRHDGYFDDYKRNGYEWHIIQAPGERYAVDFK